MPQARDTSPFASMKMSQNSPGSNNRGVSPNFGLPCLRCNKTTTNKSKICNVCVYG